MINIRFSLYKCNKNIVLLIFLCIGFYPSLVSQSLPSDIGNLSDGQLQEYLSQAKSQGLTLEQIKSLALSKGVSAEQITTFEQRVNTINNSQSTTSETNNPLSSKNTYLSPPLQNVVTKKATDPLFAYDFFNNSNINFTPNFNLPTPKNYQLGIGDEIVINIWGAAQNNYILEIDKTGAIRIPNVGPIHVNGTNIDKASAIIKSRLSRIYAGMNERANSPYKIFAEINIAKVRTIQVNIIGEVKVPGTYSLSGLSSMLNALYAAGGPTKSGSFRKIKLIRNGSEVSFFDIYKYLIEGSQQGNEILQDQDLIIIPPFISRIDVTGAVKRPGTFEMLPEENFEDLLKYTSGFKSDAYKKQFLLERIEGDRRVVKELLFTNATREKLQDGDKLSVKTIIDKYKNRIEIKGAVYRPGAYQYSEKLTLKELIEKAAGFTKSAFLERGILFRTKEDGFNRQAISFSAAQVMNNEQSIVLQPDDEIVIFDKKALHSNYNLTISGAVREQTHR